jgi:prolipoprotein diacylglyceryltransferase
MFPTINIGPLVLPTAPLIYVLGAWLGLAAVERAARRLGQPSETMYALATTGLLAWLIAARLIFVATYWSAYRDNLLGILWPLNTGFNAWGGLLVGVAAAFFYGRWQRLHPGATLDALAPVLLVALLAVSLADFLAGPGFGTLTNQPWGINQFGVRRHPVQVYEIIMALLALVAWRLSVQSSDRQKAFRGRHFLVATAVYCAGRLFVDAFRANPWVTSGGFHVIQVVCLAAVWLSLLFLAHYHEEID